MIVYRDDRTLILIDGANLQPALKSIGLHLNYQLLRDSLADRCKLLTPRYYTALLPAQEHNPLKPLLDWLAYNGYIVVSKQVKRFTDTAGVTTTKGNMDIEIAVDAMQLSPHYDHLILFSGDGDFTYLVRTLQQLGKRVSVVSVMNTVADELRRQADQFVNLADLSKILDISASA